jgi:hypothetical protein
MRLLLEIGYNKLLLPKESDATTILNAFNGIRQVREEGYGDTHKIIISGEDEQLALRLVKPEIIEEEKIEEEKED